MVCLLNILRFFGIRDVDREASTDNQPANCNLNDLSIIGRTEHFPTVSCSTGSVWISTIEALHIVPIFCEKSC